ncbi:MAG: AmmeMemoRadiSam system protein B [Gammaproteobacteria bacterium]|nr:AmmeMemoRadiSam system protein B [Gammaproteobacteria bacterium]
MSTVRQPAVAGLFYPDDPDLLRQQISQFLQVAAKDNPAPKAVIAPHAGYIYSGPVAGSAYAAVSKLRNQVNRVVLLGPAHRVHVRGFATVSAGAFRTPLGDSPVDVETIQALTADFPFVQVMDNAHAQEHSLEVHIPFLQETINEFALVPLLVGDASPQQVDAILQRLWGGPETLIVISSDLSHYHPYVTAVEIDLRTTEAIQALAPEAITHEQACGRIPVCGLLREARSRGMTVTTIDLRNSGDTAGPRDRVVGYGSYLFS